MKIFSKFTLGMAYLVSARKLCKIRNVSFGDIFIFLNSLMLRHHFISKK